MNTDTEATVAATVTDATTPSADFIRAVSDFLDTDPTDLLAKWGYYDRAAGEGIKNAVSPEGSAVVLTSGANGS